MLVQLISGGRKEAREGEGREERGRGGEERKEGREGRGKGGRHPFTKLPFAVFATHALPCPLTSYKN